MAARLLTLSKKSAYLAAPIWSFSVEFDPSNPLVSTLTAYGFSPEEAALLLRRLRRRPANEKQIRTAIAFLESKDIERPDVKRVLRTFPNTISLTTSHIENTFAHLNELYGDGAATRIIVRAPTVLGLSISRLNESIRAFNGTDIDLSESPKYFLFAPELVRARRLFLRSHDLAINKSTLGSSNELFAHRFGITRQRLLTEYAP